MFEYLNPTQATYVITYPWHYLNKSLYKGPSRSGLYGYGNTNLNDPQTVHQNTIILISLDTLR